MQNKIKYMDYDINDYIRLHRINLHRMIRIRSFGENMICLICFIRFNYPRGIYPLNTINYQYKYIWNNVKYIGPLTNNKYENELLFINKIHHCNLTYKEIYLSKIIRCCTYLDSKTKIFIHCN